MRDKRGSHLALSLARLDAVAEARPQRIGLSATVHPIEEAARFLVGHGRTVRGRRRRAPPRPRSCDRGPGHGSAGGRDARAVERDLRPPRRARRSAPNDARLRQHAPDGRARRAPPRRAARRGPRRSAPREPREGPPPAHRAAPEGGGDARARRRRRRSSWGSTSARSISCARSARPAPSRRSCSESADPGTRSGARRADASSRRRATSSSSAPRSCAQSRAGRLDRIAPPARPARRARPADRGRVLRARMDARTPSSICFARRLLSQSSTARDFDDVVASVSPRAPRRRLGRGGALLHRDRVNGVAARATGRAHRRAHQRRRDPRRRRLPRRARSRRDARRNGQRGLGDREHGGRRVRARLALVAHPARRVARGRAAGGGRAGAAADRSRSGSGEAPSRTWELSAEVSRLRADIVAKTRRGRRGRRVARRGVRLAARRGGAARGLRRRRSATPSGVVPTMDDVVFERFFDEAGGMQLVVHAPFGGRVNRAFGLALRKRFCVSFDFELQAAATDDAIVLSMGTAQSFPLSDAFHFVRSRAARRDATAGDPRGADVRRPAGAGTRRARSRCCASSAERRSRRSSSACASDDLLAAVFPAQVACQENARRPDRGPGSPARPPDAARLPRRGHGHRSGCAALLERMERGEIRLHARDTTEPSPFSHEVLNAKPYAFLDDAPLEERRARAVSLRRTLPEHQRDLGALDAGGDRARRRRGATRAAGRRRASRRAARPGRDAARGRVDSVARRRW